MSSANIVSLDVDVRCPGLESDDLDSLTRSLCKELSELETERVQLRAAGAVPKGAKVADPVTLGAIAVAVLPNLLPKVVEFLDHWVQRLQGEPKLKLKVVRGSETFELELPATGANANELKKMLEAVRAAT
jgi:hypothetical protein